MTAVDLVTAVVLPGTAALAIWYYPHCARPSLAFASMPRAAFLVCIVATGVIAAGCVALFVDLVVGHAQRLGFAEMFERELGKIREPDNATLIDSWIQAIQAFVHGSKLGPTSRNRDQRALEAALDSVVPVDPLTRWL